MFPEPDDIPDDFQTPALPGALDEWFAFSADLGEDSELIFDGAILDGLGVVDAASARLALVGYRFVFEKNVWADAAVNGGWNANWIVLDSINADPIIADLSTPGVAVLEARHGQGVWEPEQIAETLAEFIDALDVNDDVPGPPPLDEDLLPTLTVWATDLGPEPLKTLLQLRNWPLFDELSRPELLRVQKNLPAKLAEQLNLVQAQSCVEFGARFGATFEIRPD